MIITDRDMTLLMFIGELGCCSIEQAHRVYDAGGGNKWYPYKRIQKLHSEGYLLKMDKTRIIELSKKAADLIGQTRYRFRSLQEMQKRVDLADIVLEVGIPFNGNRQIRNKYNLNRQTIFKGAFQYKDNNYFLYLLPETANTTYLGQIRAELKLLASARIGKKAIVLVPTPNIMKSFGTDPCRQEELFLLPYPMGVDMLAKYFTETYQDYIKSFIPAHAVTTNNKIYADYETIDRYYTICIMNDLTKRNALQAYYLTGHKKPVTILCLRSQQKFISQHYPDADIKIVN